MTIFIVAVVSMAAFLVATVFWTENQILAEPPADVTSETSGTTESRDPFEECIDLPTYSAYERCAERVKNEILRNPELYSPPIPAGCEEPSTPSEIQRCTNLVNSQLDLQSRWMVMGRWDCNDPAFTSPSHGSAGANLPPSLASTAIGQGPSLPVAAGLLKKCCEWEVRSRPVYKTQWSCGPGIDGQISCSWYTIVEFKRVRTCVRRVWRWDSC